MSSMVFKFLSSERIEVLQSLICYHTGKEHGLKVDDAPKVVGWDDYMGESAWDESLAWDADKFSGPDYQWYEWYTYDKACSPEFAESFQCMCKMKNLFVVAGQAHSVTFLFVEVGSPMGKDDDRRDFYKAYVPNEDDLKIQKTLRFAVHEACSQSDSSVIESEQHGEHAVKNSVNVPILNRVLAALVSLMTTAFFFAGLAAGFYAALGESFFYGGFLIKLFPYQDSLSDLFRGLMRIVGGIWPATVVVAISHVIIRYLTEGKQTALVDLADMRKGFFYQLTHPFSNPRTPMNSSEEENTARTNFTTGAVIVFVVSSIFALVFLMLGKIVG